MKINPIFILQFTNVIFALACLFLLRRILKRINENENLIASSIFFVGSCFGFTRFAVDNECYIIPLFFSLLALSSIQVFLRKNSLKIALLSALFSSIACLFHQISIIILIASFLVIAFNNKRNNIIGFISISLIVPIFYSIIYYVGNNGFSILGLWDFILSDYRSGYAEMPILRNVLLLSILSFIRTFVQVHGYIIEILGFYPIISYIIIFLSLGMGIFGLIHFFKLKKRELKMFFERRFVRYIWGILILSLGFASFSNGNAEFMVIIPFLIIILLLYYYTSSAKYLLGIGSSIFIWNLLFGLYPYAYAKINPHIEIADFIINNKDNSAFILRDINHSENIILYRYGLDFRNNISIYKFKELDNKDFQVLKDNYKNIYTDCFGGKEAISRNKIINNNEQEYLIEGFSEKNFTYKDRFTSLGKQTELWIYNK